MSIPTSFVEANLGGVSDEGCLDSADGQPSGIPYCGGHQRLGSRALVAKRDLAYGLVIAWALAGIAANQGGHPEVASLAQAGAPAIAMAILLLGLVGAMKRMK